MVIFATDRLRHKKTAYFTIESGWFRHTSAIAETTDGAKDPPRNRKTRRNAPRLGLG